MQLILQRLFEVSYLDHIFADPLGPGGEIGKRCGLRSRWEIP